MMDSADQVVVYVVVLVLAVALLGWFFAGIWRRAPGTGSTQEQQEQHPAAENRRRGLARMIRRPREEIDGGDVAAEDGDDDEDDDEDEENDDPIVGNEGVFRRNRIGTKKRRKMEMKEARREYRQQQEEIRLKKKEEDMAAEREKRKQERAEEAARAKEEEERLAEIKRKEEEEYEQWRAEIQVEEAGAERDESVDPNDTKRDVINYIMREKVILIEEAASHFGFRPDELAKLLEELLASKSIDGLLDREQGKFLLIPLQERRKLAELIRQRGRISLQELAWEASRLIDLTPVDPKTSS